jgi:hypothetical protein
MNSRKFAWRPTSGEIYCVGLGRVDFYLPLLKVRGKRIKVSLQYIANHPGISAGHKDHSIIRKCGSFNLVALGRIGCEEIAYREGDNMWSTIRYRIGIGLIGRDVKGAAAE